MSIIENVQPAVKKETGKVAAITGIGLILMWIVFGVLHAFMPQKIPFDYTVFLGGAVGGCVAVLNFFFMGLAVQKAAAATDEDTARMRIKASYSQRMLIQMLHKPVMSIITIQLTTIVSLILNGPRTGTSMGNVKNILAPLISNSILFIHLLSLPVLFRFDIEIPIC